MQNPFYKMQHKIKALLKKKTPNQKSCFINTSAFCPFSFSPLNNFDQLLGSLADTHKPWWFIDILFPENYGLFIKSICIIIIY